MPKIKGEVTREGMPVEWDAAERRRSLFQHWVEADYEIVDGVSKWVEDSDEEGGGYLPMASPAIVSDFVRLRVGDEAGLCAFARRWGRLEYEELVLRDAPGLGYAWAHGDPVAWIWGHLGGVQTALALWKFWREQDVDAFNRYLDRRRFPRAVRRLGPINALLKKGKFVEAQRRITEYFADVSSRAESVGDIVIVAGDRVRVDGWIYPGEDVRVRSWPGAWMIIRRIINPNLSGVHTQIDPQFSRHPDAEIVAMGWDSLMSVVYRHLFEILASGEVEECRECGTPFIRNDGRQRFCPPAPLARESLCAMRFHKREQRKRKSEAPATDRIRGGRSK
jgi:hypothetical protein